jgi:hypothetical protein
MKLTFIHKYLKYSYHKYQVTIFILKSGIQFRKLIKEMAKRRLRTNPKLAYPIQTGRALANK